jgi:hypothetical protein
MVLRSSFPRLHLTTPCGRCGSCGHPFGLCRCLHKIRDDAREAKAEAARMAQESRQAEGRHRKAVQEDMGIVRGGCASREVGACLKPVSGEWNEQVPKQMRTFLDGKWGGCGNQLQLAAQRRLARDPCTNTTHWMCSADSFMPPGRLWASWYKLHQVMGGDH